MADRPVECSHCKKTIKVCYKEMVDDMVVCSEMCGECPVVEQKLHGLKQASGTSDPGICCSNCRTTLESVKMGNELGCSECYGVFSDVIISELQASEKSRDLKGIYSKKGGIVHMGKTPNKGVEIALSSKIASLNEALNEALKKENYEQAAWLRDQIKALTEKPDQKHGSS